MKRILHVRLHDGVGGMETIIDLLCTGMNARGINARVHSLDYGAPHQGQTRSRFLRMAGLARAVQEFRPDVVFTHSALPNLYYGLGVGFPPQIAVVHSPGSDLLRPPLRQLEAVLERRRVGTIFVSNVARMAYLDHFNTSGDRLWWVPNGVSSSLSARRRRVPATEFVAVSRIVPSKDLLTTLKGFEIMHGAAPESRLHIVGDAPDPSTLQTLVDYTRRSPVLGHAVKFWGQRNDVAEILDRSDVLIHSSHYEAQPTVVAEAAIQGLAALVTTAVRPAIWWPGSYSFFEAGDSVELGRKLLEVRDSQAFFDTAYDMHADARKALDVHRMVSRYIEIADLALRWRRRGDR